MAGKTDNCSNFVWQ